MLSNYHICWPVALSSLNRYVYGMRDALPRWTSWLLWSAWVTNIFTDWLCGVHKLGLTVDIASKIIHSHFTSCVCFVNNPWMISKSACIRSHVSGFVIKKAKKKKRACLLYLKAVVADSCTQILPCCYILSQLVGDIALIKTLSFSEHQSLNGLLYSF